MPTILACVVSQCVLVLDYVGYQLVVETQWDRGDDEKSQYENLSFFGHLRLAGILVTSGDLVRPLSNNDAASYDSSSSLMKLRSQKRSAFMFASSWSEK